MATEAILNTDGTARPIARMQVVDKETGAKTETDVYTCARAVTCNEGIDLQTHLETLHGHAEDTTVHLTAEEKRGLETTAGAQEKANAALAEANAYTDTKAVDLAASMNAATSAKIAAALETAAGEAATKANEARAAAVTEATTIATEKAAAAERASAPALHASQHAASGSDPITPAAINAVNKAGDTMTGFLNMSIHDGNTAQMIQWQNFACLRIASEIDNVYTELRVHTNESEIDPKYVRKLSKDSAEEIYDLLHTGNKPSGSYTGNGSATTRTIEIGGIGNVLAVWEFNETFLLVSPAGAMLYHEHSNTLQAFKPNVMKFENGVLTMNNNSYGNHSGVGYYYQLL